MDEIELDVERLVARLEAELARLRLSRGDTHSEAVMRNVFGDSLGQREEGEKRENQ